MQQYRFIFSNEKEYRIWRHVAFWAFWALFQGFLYAFIPMPPPINYSGRLPSAMVDSLLFLPSHMFLSYTLMYFVIPVYVIKSKYLFAALWTVILIIATASISAVTSSYLIEPIKEVILPKKLLLPTYHSGSFFFFSLLAGLRGGLTVGGLAAAIKLMKHWYVEGQRNLQLQKENVESQLQLLKSQVHPHFLFNTLNNIYSYTQNTSQIASKLVMGLSDILRYMLYECNQSLVPLTKELRMIEEYINLEKIRYGNKLELHVGLPDASDEYIAPLLLLSFIGNCFKHRLSQVLENPWMNLDISIEDRLMTMKLVNGKPAFAKQMHLPGIGIENVRRRLELLYPNKQKLGIKSEEEIFIVTLKLELQRKYDFSKPVTQQVVLAVNA